MTRINGIWQSSGSSFRFVSISSTNRWNITALNVTSEAMIPYIFLFDRATTKLEWKLSEWDFTKPFFHLGAQPLNLQCFELNLNSSINIISIPFCSRFIYSHADSNSFLIISVRNAGAGLDSSLRYDILSQVFNHRAIVTKETLLTSLNDSKSSFRIKLQVILLSWNRSQNPLIQRMWWGLIRLLSNCELLFCSSLMDCSLILKLIETLIQLLFT